MEADRDYHIRRARDELDLAYRTEHVRAISAHLRLCALHIGQLQASGPSEPESSRSRAGIEFVI